MQNNGRGTVEEIKARIPIDELIGSYIKLEKAGRSLKARCPFHNEKSPSFFVSPDRGGYYCFGCGAKGDIFSFVEQFEGLDFRGALKVLAEKAGVPLVFDKKADGDKDRLFEITEQAAIFFEAELAKNAEAREYLNKRGLSPESIKNFRIGWSPDEWQGLHDFLKKKGWTEQVMEKAGLIKKKEGANSYYDRFRGRIIFPITDSGGRVVAFTGRILKDDGKSAKYLNSPETPLFSKSAILFGLDKAKSEIRRTGYSILVEGQMDLVLSHQVGVKNTIAASGTALTDQAVGTDGTVSNLGMVRRLSPNMIIALDSDKAGRLAAMRAVAATALAMGMSVKIADIEGGKDPADLILGDPESWKEVLRKAKHVIEFELGNIMKEVSDPYKVAKAIRERIFPYLSKLDSEMDKAFYVKTISEKTGLAELAIWEDLQKYVKTALDNIQVNNPPAGGGKKERKEQVAPIFPSSNLRSLHGAKPTHRFDLVERRMFGLLALMESLQLPRVNEFREQIKKIAGDSYEERVKRLARESADLSFEAEAFYGNDPKRLDVHMSELVINFEEDLINEELIKSMGELRLAEKAGDNAKVGELAKKCQALSIRKAEVLKQRKH